MSAPCLDGRDHQRQKARVLRTLQPPVVGLGVKITIEFSEDEDFPPDALPALHEALKLAFASLGGRIGAMLVELDLKKA